MKPSILYISYTGLTEPLGQSQILSYLKGLASEYNIHILSVEKKQDLQSSQKRIQTICENYNIQWHHLNYHRKPPGISTLYDIYSLRKKAKRLHRKVSFDLVHCRSYIPALVGLYLKRNNDIKFIFDMRGFWVDERVEGNLWNLQNPVYKLAYKYFKKKEKEFFTESDHIISLTREGKKEIESRDINEATISYIPTCVDFNLFNYDAVSHRQTNDLRKKLNISKLSFVFIYLGSIGSWYLTKEMLKVFVAIKQVQPEAAFLFLTREDPQIIYNEIEDLPVNKDDILITSASREEVPVYLSLANASVLFYRPTFSKKGTAPTKLGELMGMGIPVIANKDIGDVEKIITDSKAGIVVDVENEVALREAGKAIIPFSEKMNKQFVRKKAIEYFDLKEGINNYKKIYKELII